MSITKRNFGNLPDGKIVYEYCMTNQNGMMVKVINYGAIITAIDVPDRNEKIGNVAIGYDTLNSYLNDNCYLGAIVGRYANRIANAQFELDGTHYKLEKNLGNHHLHGGIIGFSKVFWEIEIIHSEKGETIQLHYLSKAGEEGYPGNLDVYVHYILTTNNSLLIEIRATTDEKTIVNLTNHSYFNLSAGEEKDILSHQLQILASQYLPVDESVIPTGKIEKVVNTPMDFRTSKSVGEEIELEFDQLKFGAGYDNSWIIDKKSENEFCHAATLIDPKSGRIMDVYTSEPAIHFYSGNYLNIKKEGEKEDFGCRYALALETQHYPDSPNKPNFPSVILDVGENYYSKTEFCFSTIK